MFAMEQPQGAGYSCLHNGGPETECFTTRMKFSARF